ncbi:chemotaxis protein CheW [Paenibacillus sp. 2003]|uniref:chemotaxis protein CheW n=1 Tax=Paenibacillus TaxID=44249 RepID=UPI002861002C|nr:chemotaxis protein CheW [Paenibacillus sp. 2003]MDR6717717.1 chemotaxis protein histidine kinase CheA [Paenibacillus sp. 2003]
MLPIDQLFSRFPRLVRNLSQKLGKDLELVIQGGETELDRMIIEELSDPLIHLIPTVLIMALKVQRFGRLNGIIDIDTEVGVGTTFTIRLPLTLAIIKGLLVKVSGRVLILPMYNVAEIVRISPEDIQMVIVRSVDKIAAYAVDEIIGNQEVVIKTLGTYLGAMNHLSGATILGNGKVALILYASYLVSL